MQIYFFSLLISTFSRTFGAANLKLVSNMIRSMTGYGKAECLLKDGKIIVEIRSLNGKNSDIGIKSAILPREKEMEIRQYITQTLQRGNIDLFASWEQNPAAPGGKIINPDIFKSYFRQIEQLRKETGIPENDPGLLSALLRMPDILESSTRQEFTPQEWEQFRQAVREAVRELDEFRCKEGRILEADLRKRVALIESLVSEVEPFETRRTELIKERLKAKIQELGIAPDENRLEQEIIYYLEKLDITEEKVRLRQHCRYFLETLDKDPLPGKKLGFIAQEMGREINTLGSKSNQADMQQRVVRMKDELEKIKEQALNIL